MKWFKHYTDASTGETLELIFELEKHVGLACYWLLLEDCARTWRDPSKPPRFKKTMKHIRSLFKVSTKTVQHLLNMYQVHTGLEFTEESGVYEIYIPKLAEIKDNHFKNLQVKTKRLGQKITPRGKRKSTEVEAEVEEETKGELPLRENSKLHALAVLWNTHADKVLPRVDSMSKTTSRFRACSARWKENPENAYWIQVIERMNRSKYCTGRSERHFLASFGWFTRTDKHTEILEGRYDKLFEDGRSLTRGEKASQKSKELFENNPYRGES